MEVGSAARSRCSQCRFRSHQTRCQWSHRRSSHLRRETLRRETRTCLCTRQLEEACLAEVAMERVDSGAAEKVAVVEVVV